MTRKRRKVYKVKKQRKLKNKGEKVLPWSTPFKIFGKAVSHFGVH